MKWIKLKDRKPTEEIDGEKLLVCRVLNEGQINQNPSILSTNKIHLCDVNETWWMSIPELPIELTNFN